MMENTPVSANGFGPYSKHFQALLLQHIFNDDEVCAKAVAAVHSDDFGLPVYKVIWETIREYWLQHGQRPSFEIFRMSLMNNVKDHTGRYTTVTREELPFLSQTVYQIFTVSRESLNPEQFKSEIPHFIRHVRSVAAYARSRMEVELGGGTEALLHELQKIHQETSALDSESSLVSYEDEMGVMESEDDMLVRIPTGISKLDRYLDGGLGLTHLGMVTAISGVGKTNCLDSFASAAVANGFKTLFVTLELPAKEITRRFTAMSSVIPADILKKKMVREWDQKYRRRYDMMRGPNYPYKGLFNVYDRAGIATYISDIEAVVKNGDYQLILVDWLDLLLDENGNKNDPDHKKLADLTKGLKGLATRNNVAVWTATQGTREAAGRTVLGMEHVAGAWAKNNALDIGMGLAPDVDDRGENDEAAASDEDDLQPMKMVFSVNKNRYGKTGALSVYRATSLRIYDNEEKYEIHEQAIEQMSTPVSVATPLPAQGAPMNYESNITGITS